MSTDRRMLDRPQDSLRMLLGLGLALALVYAWPRITTVCAGLGLLFFLPFGVFEALDGILGPGRRHVTLRVQMGLIFLLAMALGLPGTLLYYLGMALLFVVSLAAVSSLERLLRRVRKKTSPGAVESVGDPGSWSSRRLLLSLLRPLTFCRHAETTSLTRAVWIAAVQSATVIGLWPLLREFAIEVMNRFHQSANLFTWPIEMWQLPVSLSTAEHWRDATIWEAWSLGRWWLLLGAIAFACYTVAKKREPGVEHDGWRQLRRVLLFAPWLVLLEITYLMGLWIADKEATPEPVALYAVDWLWESWPMHVWLIRGLVPTAVAGLVFFRAVIGWSWRRCACAVVAFVPIALFVSIVWSLFYAQLFLSLE